MVTLDEALKTANNAVLMAINAISILISEMHIKFLDVPKNEVKELKAPEIIRILEGYKEANIGFGAGYTLKTSIVRAIYDCPFLSVGVKDLNGVVICILASSGVINSNDVHTIIQNFRQTTECEGEIVVSVVHEPTLETNLIVTTLITVGFSGRETSHKNSIFSRLAEHFPFIFNLLGKHHPQSHNTKENYSPERSCLSEMINRLESTELPNIVPVDGTAEGFGIYSAELQMLLSNSGDEIYPFRGHDCSSEQSEAEFLEASADSSMAYDRNTGGAPTFQREMLLRHDMGPGNHFAQEWATKGATDSGATRVLDSPMLYRLPIGVKPSELKDGPNVSNTSDHPEKTIINDIKAQPQVTPSMPLDPPTDAGFEAVMDIFNNTSVLLKGDNTNVSKKQGVLSVRAASMLVKVFPSYAFYANCSS
ncbi:unnamed protein product [Ilex paraguariensis]|uniref:Uncharacterized protein n=1 Tax=Ilex paraguariensis TaxID=185542 RepID=A0ABC8UEW7_9AQUA